MHNADRDYIDAAMAMVRLRMAHIASAKAPASSDRMHADVARMEATVAMAAARRAARA